MGCLLKCPSSFSPSYSALALPSQRITTYYLATPIWAQQKMLVMSNEAHRHMDHGPGFTFITDGKRLRLFQGGNEVCRGQQQASERDEVYRCGKASSVSQQIDQENGRRRQGPGRGRRCCGTSCRKSQVLGVSQ